MFMKKIVLLIDDDPEEHEIFLLGTAKYKESIEVLSAHSGEEALNMLKKAFPHYIFLDINMPKMNGMEVLEKLKSDSDLKTIPIFLYSTSDGMLSRDLGLKLGAKAYFKKPNSVDELKPIFERAFTVDH